MSDWSWEWLPSLEEVAAGLPTEVLSAVEKAAADLATVNSMVYLDGVDFQGTGPGVRTHSDPARKPHHRTPRRRAWAGTGMSCGPPGSVNSCGCARQGS
ncbi:hypothetical protein [Embleya sp. NBC_00896]|uniref:hypothetical protein n=1 Tax=Embleya sp. NBC_00896 TaxID=2975961 RepID=UPI002F912D0A|nr:hypothetical protein OG928_44790 [Embleya sp. NBC_00896]